MTCIRCKSCCLIRSLACDDPLAVSARPRFCTVFAFLLSNSEFLSLSPAERVLAYEEVWMGTTERFGMKKKWAIFHHLDELMSRGDSLGNIGRSIIAEALQATVHIGAVQSRHLDAYIGHGIGFLPTEKSVFVPEVITAVI